MEEFECKCCGQAARWCGDAEDGCGIPECDHIHCDHCGMHYSLESDAAKTSETMSEARDKMRASYNTLPGSRQR